MVSDAGSMAFDHESVTLPLSHPRPLHLFVSLSFCLILIDAQASLPNSAGGNSNYDVLDRPSFATARKRFIPTHAATVHSNSFCPQSDSNA